MPLKMRSMIWVCLLLSVSIFLFSCEPEEEVNEETAEPENAAPQVDVELPAPEPSEEGTFEDLLYHRQSRRDFVEEELPLEDLSQIAWSSAGVGVDGTTGATRTAPSAGATDPMEVFIVAGEVDGMEPGIYHYDYTSHELDLVKEGDYRAELSSAALGQEFVEDGAASIVMAAKYERTKSRYGERGERYVHMEVGHMAQNVYLQVEALDSLGTVAIGAFDDDDVAAILETDYEPLMIMPVGKVTQ